jgi:hypothetical protein
MERPKAMNVQFITNSKGQTSGVFIPIEDWELIKKELDSKMDIPEWHKEILVDRQAKFQTGNAVLVNADAVLKDIESRL